MNISWNRPIRQLVLLGFLLASLSAWADKPGLISSAFIWRQWEYVGEVPVPHCRALARAADGALWIGTFNGATRWLGDQAWRYGPDTGNGFSNRWAVSLLSSQDGKLWAGTDDGVVIFEHGAWSAFPEAAEPPHGLVEALAKGPDGHLYASIATNCYCFDGRRFVAFPTPSRRAGDTSPVRLIFDREGRLWGRTDSVFAKFENGAWHTVLAPSVEQGWIRGIGNGGLAGVWVATDQSLIQYKNGEVERTLVLPEHMQHDWLQVLEDSQRNIWVAAYSNGIAVFMPDGRTLVGDQRFGLSSWPFFSLMEDGEGNVCVGSNGAGVFLFRPRRAYLVTPPSSAEGGAPGFRTIVSAGGETLLAGTARGKLYEVSAKTGVMAKVESPLPADEPVEVLLAGRAGRLWAGTRTKGLWRSKTLRPAGLEKVAMPPGRISALHEDRDGTLFVGTQQGAYLLRENGLAPVSDLIGTNASVSSFAEEASGGTWIGASTGLFLYSHGKTAPVPISLPGAPRADIAALLADSRGHLWAALRDGSLCVRRDGAWRLVPGGESAGTQGLGLLAEDGQQRLWLGHQRGLRAFSIPEMDNYIEKAAAAPAMLRLSDHDDLPGDDFGAGGSAAWCQDERGHLWFAAPSALAWVDPKALLVNESVPEVFFLGAQAGGKLAPQAASGSNLARLWNVKEPVVVHYYSASFTLIDDIYFEYRLGTEEAPWVPNGHSRQLTLPVLPPGKYRIEVRAINPDGVRHAQGGVLQLEVHPFYFERTEVRVVTGVSVLALVSLGGRWGLKRYVGRKHADLEVQGAAARAKLAEVSREADRMRREAQLHEAHRLEALGTMAGGIAHDFNNLLQSILGNTELAKIKRGHPDEIVEHLDAVVNASHRARALVAQILLSSRQEKPQRVAVSVGPVVKDSVKLLRSGVSPNIRIEVSVPDNLPPILGDPSAIQRIVTNLGTNAAHAMQPKGGNLWISLEVVELFGADVPPVAGLSPGKYVCLTVTDAGHGMDAETQRRAFEPFFTTKQPGEGTGLGLSVVRGIVQSLAGGIRLRSTVGVGTQFDVYLPVTKEDVAVEETVHSEVSPSGEARVMIVDDDPCVLGFAVEAGNLLGYDCVGFSSPLEALEAFRSEPSRFDMAITDLAMPGLSGHEFAAAIWAIRPKFSIVLATGYAEGLKSNVEIASGFSAVMAKPYGLDAFADTVGKVLAKNCGSGTSAESNN